MNNIQVQDSVESCPPFSDCTCQNHTNCDICILKILYPGLIQENNLKFGRIQQLLRHFKQALEQEGMINLTIDGQVQFATPKAEQLLNQYFSPYIPHSLPIRLQVWFKCQVSQLTESTGIAFSCSPLQIEQAGRRLIIRFLPDLSRQQYLLLLEEQEERSFSIAALELLGLTRREAEVLFWIAKDKSNAGIAKVLGCCEGTVRKHLENLYKKLGVQTRMGAVMVALEKLGLLHG